MGKNNKSESYKTPFIKSYATLPSSQLINKTIAVWDDEISTMLMCASLSGLVISVITPGVSIKSGLIMVNIAMSHPKEMELKLSSAMTKLCNKWYASSASHLSKNKVIEF